VEKRCAIASRREVILDVLAPWADRRPIIQRLSYGSAKGTVGMGDEQGHPWPSLQPHLAMVTRALTWLKLQRHRPGRPIPGTTPGIMQTALPRRAASGTC